MASQTCKGVGDDTVRSYNKLRWVRGGEMSQLRGVARRARNRTGDRKSSQSGSEGGHRRGVSGHITIWGGVTDTLCTELYRMDEG